MKNKRYLSDTRKQVELKKKSAEKELLMIGVKKDTHQIQDCCCSMSIDIKRIENSIKSGFTRVPQGLSQNEMLDFILNN